VPRREARVRPFRYRRCGTKPPPYQDGVVLETMISADGSARTGYVGYGNRATLATSRASESYVMVDWVRASWLLSCLLAVKPRGAVRACPLPWPTQHPARRLSFPSAISFAPLH
jgi:hypothetical protein